MLAATRIMYLYPTLLLRAWATPTISIAITHFQMMGLCLSFNLEYPPLALNMTRWICKVASIDVIDYASFDCVTNVSYGARWWLCAALPLALVLMAGWTAARRLVSFCFRDDATISPMTSEDFEPDPSGGAPPTTIRDEEEPPVVRQQSFEEDEEKCTEGGEGNVSQNPGIARESSSLHDLLHAATDDDEGKERHKDDVGDAQQALPENEKLIVVQHSRYGNTDQCIVVGSIVMFVYVAQHSLKVFNCSSQGYLQMYPKIDCASDGGPWAAMAVGAYIFIAFLIGAVVFIAIVSKKQRPKYGFIFEKYGSGCSQWWELAEALKKSLAVAATVFLSDSGLNQASAMALIVLLSIWAQIQFKPFKRDYLVILQIQLLVSLMIQLSIEVMYSVGLLE